ncbi:MAG: MATE family efflux transporter [Pseudomonadota bacterium]
MTRPPTPVTRAVMTVAAPLTRSRVLALAGPVVLAQAATAMTGVVDTAVMGLYGDKVDLAAVAIASAAFGFIYWGFGFLRMSTTGLTAQAAGGGDDGEAKAVLLRAMLLGGGIGLVLLLLFTPIRWAALAAFEAEANVEALARGYFDARIWGAPALLMSYGITGWLIGRGRTGQLLAFQVVMNGVNIVLDVWFVAGLGWGPAGIGAGTAMAEWIALVFGVWMVRDAFSGAGRLLQADKLAALFVANRDIMIRTLALVFSFAWFVRAGTTLETATVAGNEVLLQFITVSAFVLDSFAFVAEKEAGEAFGARDPDRLKRAMRITSELAIGFGAAIALLYLLGGPLVLNAIIADADARAAALAFMPFCAAVPFIGVPAWQLDGIFLGATRGKALRTAGVISAALYVGTDLLLRPSFGNTGLWAAFLMMYIYRAVCLGAYLPGLLKSLEPGAARARP